MGCPSSLLPPSHSQWKAGMAYPWTPRSAQISVILLTSTMEGGDGARAGAAPASLPQVVHEDLILFISENVRAETLVEGGLGLRQASAERLLAKHSVPALLALLRAASLANAEEEVSRVR